MKTMRIDYYREFIMLARVKNFQVAAEELFISQSGLSRHMIAMEEEMDVQLFERGSKETVLTEAGKSCFRMLVKSIRNMTAASWK